MATRMRISAFKRILALLRSARNSSWKDPWVPSSCIRIRHRLAIFLAGRIGITPFLSILREVAKGKLPTAALSLYSNRRPEDVAFLKHLQELC